MSTVVIANQRISTGFIVVRHFFYAFGVALHSKIKGVTKPGINSIILSTLVFCYVQMMVPAVFSQGWSEVARAADGVYAKPYRFVGKIYTFWRNGAVNQATGFLVGRSHVMTAGHVLYNERRESPYMVMFTPAEYNGAAPMGSANATSWVVAQPFLNGNKFYDYAVIRLNRPLGDRTLGWFAMEDWAQNSQYQGEVCGYSAQLNSAKSQFKVNGTAFGSLDWDPRNRRGLHWSINNVPWMGGVSGAPLFLNRNGSYRVVGIYTGAAPNGIGGVKLLREVRTELQSWINNNP